MFRRVGRSAHDCPRACSGETYQFRVCAVNAIGQSKPVDTNEVTAKSPFDVPGAPGTPDVHDITVGRIESSREASLSSRQASTCRVTWTVPRTDGGSPIIGYLVERKQGAQGAWTSV